MALVMIPLFIKLRGASKLFLPKARQNRLDRLRHLRRLYNRLSHPTILGRCILPMELLGVPTCPLSVSALGLVLLYDV